MDFSMLRLHIRYIFKVHVLILVLLLLILPALATTKASLEIASNERSYDSVYNPIISKVSPEFKLGKGIVTTTYEISSYPGTGVSNCVGWGRVDTQTYIPYFYFKDRRTTPQSGPIVGQSYKEVNTFEITESLGDLLFSAWLNAQSVCQSMLSVTEVPSWQLNRNLPLISNLLMGAPLLAMGIADWMIKFLI